MSWEINSLNNPISVEVWENDMKLCLVASAAESPWELHYMVI